MKAEFITPFISVSMDFSQFSEVGKVIGLSIKNSIQFKTGMNAQNYYFFINAAPKGQAVCEGCRLGI
jgi:hypothetical protein